MLKLASRKCSRFPFTLDTDFQILATSGSHLALTLTNSATYGAHSNLAAHKFSHFRFRFTLTFGSHIPVPVHTHPWLTQISHFWFTLDFGCNKLSHWRWGEPKGTEMTIITSPHQTVFLGFVDGAEDGGRQPTDSLKCHGKLNLN